MEYNKTKRGLEKAAGIVGTVVSSLMLFTYIILFIYFLTQSGVQASHTTYDGYTYEEFFNPEIGPYVAQYCTSLIFLIIICMISLIFSSKVIKSPVQADGSVQSRTGKRVCMLIFNLLSGQIVSCGLIIAVLCLRDFPKPKPQPQAIYQPQPQVQPVKSTIDSKLIELKHMKELGIIDEEVYKNAVQKIINDNL